MSLAHSPLIVTNGLTFYYDMQNTYKSFVGQPTTNLINPTLSTWSLDGSGYSVLGSAVFNDALYQATVTNNASNTRLINSFSITPSLPYTFSLQYRNLSNTAPTLTFQIQARDAGGTVINSVFTTTAQLGITNVSGWQTATYTFTPATGTTTIIWFVNTGQDFASYTGVFQYKNFQAEQRSFTTPFTSSSRTATGAVKDLTKLNTITASNLVYTNDNTSFTFNGSTSQLTAPDFGASKSAAPLSTLNIWMNLTRKSGGGSQFQFVAGFRNDANYDFYFLLIDNSGSTVTTEARLRTQTSTFDINVPFTTYFGQWVNVAFVANSTRSDLYINGVLAGSNTSVTGNFGSSASSFYVGSNYPAYGTISSVSYYNRALSDLEIAQNFNALKGRYGL